MISGTILIKSWFCSLKFDLASRHFNFGINDCYSEDCCCNKNLCFPKSPLKFVIWFGKVIWDKWLFLNLVEIFCIHLSFDQVSFLIFHLTDNKTFSYVKLSLLEFLLNFTRCNTYGYESPDEIYHLTSLFFLLIL